MTEHNHAYTQPGPESVMKRNACSMCWRQIGHGTFYLQTLDGCDRALCEACKTLLFPVVPEGMEGHQIRRIDAKAAFAQIEAELLSKSAQ